MPGLGRGFHSCPGTVFGMRIYEKSVSLNPKFGAKLAIIWGNEHFERGLRIFNAFYVLNPEPVNGYVLPISQLYPQLQSELSVMIAYFLFFANLIFKLPKSRYPFFPTERRGGRKLNRRVEIELKLDV